MIITNDNLIIESKNFLLSKFKSDIEKYKNTSQTYNELMNNYEKLKNNDKFKKLKKEYEETIEELKDSKKIQDYIITIFDLYSFNNEINSNNLENIKEYILLIEKEQELREELKGFTKYYNLFIKNFKEYEGVESIKNILNETTFENLEPDTFMNIINKLFKEIHKNEQLNLLLDSFLKYNSINFIKDIKTSSLISSINSFENLSNIDKNEIYDNIKKIKYYTNANREKELTTPALKFNDNIKLYASEETKAWIAFAIKTLKDATNDQVKEFLDNIRKENQDWVQLEVIEEIENLSSKNLLSEITNLDLYTFPYPIQVLSEKLLTYNLDSLTNVIDLLDKVSPDSFDKYINNIIDNGLDISKDLIEKGLDGLDAASLGKSLAIRKSFELIWNKTPDFIKEKIPYYKVVKETRENIVKYLKDAISNKIQHEEIKNYLESKLGVFAVSKDNIIQNLGNNQVKSTLKVFENVGTQTINENLYKLKNEFIKNIEKDMSILPEINPSSKVKTSMAQQLKVLEPFLPYYIGSIEELEQESNNMSVTKNIFNNFRNGTYPIIFLKEKLQKVNIDDEKFLKFKEINDKIEKGISPNLNELKNFLDNDLKIIKDILIINYENPKIDVVNSYLEEIKNYYSNIYAQHYFDQNNIKLKFERETFLEDLLNQIDKATTPNYKKEYYLDSFISINHKDSSSYFSYDVYEDFNSKLTMLNLSKKDLYTRIKSCDGEKTPTYIKNFKNNFINAYTALELLEDYIKLDKVLNSGDIAFISDIDSYLNDSFKLTNYLIKENDNNYLKFLKNEINNKVKEFRDVNPNNISNKTLLGLTKNLASKNKTNEIKNEFNHINKDLSKIDEFTFSSKYAPEQILKDKTLNKNKTISKKYLEIEILSMELKSNDSSKWLDVIEQNKEYISPFILEKSFNSIDVSIEAKKTLSNLLNSNDLLIDFVIDNKENKNIELVEFLSKNSTQIIESYFKNLKYDSDISNIDPNIKKLMLVSNFNKNKITKLIDKNFESLSLKEQHFIKQTDNEFLLDIITLKNNKEVSPNDQRAFDIIINKSYILKSDFTKNIINDTNNKFLSNIYNQNNRLTKKSSGPVINLSEFSLEELKTINSSKYVKKYFSNLFKGFMNNKLDEHILEKMSKNSLDLEGFSNENLNYVREKSMFATIEKSLEEFVESKNSILLSNNKFVVLFNKTETQLKDLDIAINDFLETKKIDSIDKLNFNNNEEELKF